jgi:hypothetical protein
LNEYPAILKKMRQPDMFPYGMLSKYIEKRKRHSVKQDRASIFI